MKCFALWAAFGGKALPLTPFSHIPESFWGQGESHDDFCFLSARAGRGLCTSPPPALTLCPLGAYWLPPPLTGPAWVAGLDRGWGAACPGALPDLSPGSADVLHVLDATDAVVGNLAAGQADVIPEAALPIGAEPADRTCVRVGKHAGAPVRRVQCACLTPQPC